MNLSTYESFKTLKSDGVGIPLEGETLKKCQKTILGIAEDVIALCEEEGIWHQLGGGSALGAVRHGGFIPWDDDIDLNVLGRDFERLRQKIEERFGDKYTFLDYSTPGYGLPMGKVMLNGTVFRDGESFDSDNCGFFVDITPLENAPDSPLLRKLHGMLCMIAGGLLSCRKFFMRRAYFRALADRNPEIRPVVRTKILIGLPLAVLPYSAYARLTNRIYGLCRNERSRYVIFPAGRKHYFGEMHPREDIVPTVPMPFEGHNWPVAANYGAYLTALYGVDYMTPQKESEREHHIILELRFPEE